MIFATVGTQLPFDRLLDGLNGWADKNPDRQIVAQTGASGTAFDKIDCRPFLTQSEFREMAEKADLIVSHAGMGTILTAAELGKPIIVMARKAELGEHRNDHQAATVAEMSKLPNVIACEDAQSLAGAIDAALKIQHNSAPTGANISARASDELIDAVALFIRGEL